jgi:hypothetical protein
MLCCCCCCFASQEAAAARCSAATAGNKKARQATLEESMRITKRLEADEKVAMFFYAEGIAFNKARSPFFLEAIQAIAAAGAGYKPPGYNSLRTNLLTKAKKKLNDKLGLLDLRTLASDGWTDVQDNPLINITQTNAAGTKFEDAVNTSGQVKDAPFIFGLMSQHIERVGPANVVQIVMDGAAANGAAGDMIEEQ